MNAMTRLARLAVCLCPLLLFAQAAAAQSFARTDYTVGPNSTWGMATGDLNNDGNVDIVAIGSQGDVFVYLGNGSGGFTASALSSLGTGTASGYVAIGDVTGDGAPDIVAAAGRLLVLAGHGDGTFDAGVVVGAFEGARTVALADFDRDGLTDVAVGSIQFAHTSGGVVILRNTNRTPAGFVASTIQSINTNQLVANTISIADANGDGTPDLLLANAASVVLFRITVNATGPRFSVSNTTNFYQQSAGSSVWFATFADATNDGVDDLIYLLQTAASALVVCPNYGQAPCISKALKTGVGSPFAMAFHPFFGTLSAAILMEAGPVVEGVLLGVASLPYRMVSADFNEDGRPDLAVGYQMPGSNNSRFSVYLNTSSAVTSPTLTATADPTNHATVTLTSLPVNGTWSGEGMTFAPGREATVSLTPGTYTFTYTVPTTPPVSGTTTVTVLPSPVLVCQAALPALFAAEQAAAALLAAADAQVADLNQQIASLTQQLAAAVAAAGAAQASLDAAQQSLVAANAKIATLNAQIAALTAQIAALAAQVAEANAQLTAALAARSALQTSTATAAETIAARDASIAALNSQIAGLSSQIEALNAETTDRTSQFNALTAQLAAGTAEKTALQEGLTAAQLALAARDAALATVNAKLTTAHAQLASALTLETALIADVAAARAERASMQSQLEAAIAANASLQSHIGSANEDKLALQTAITAVNQDTAALLAALAAVNQDKTSLQAALTAAQETIAALTLQGQQSGVTLQAVQSELARVTAALAAAQPGFTLPGSFAEQLTKLVNAVLVLPKGQQQQLIKDIRR